MTSIRPHRSFAIALAVAVQAIAMPCMAVPVEPIFDKTSAHPLERQRNVPTMRLVNFDGTLPMIAARDTGIDGTSALLFARPDAAELGSGKGAAERSVAAYRSPQVMGLQLPEPGPLSAILATLGLGAFFFVRRLG